MRMSRRDTIARERAGSNPRATRLSGSGTTRCFSSRARSPMQFITRSSSAVLVSPLSPALRAGQLPLEGGAKGRRLDARHLVLRFRLAVLLSPGADDAAV